MNNDANGRSFTLTLTANCNLKCSYCYEHQKKLESMSFEVAKCILDKEMPAEHEGITYIELFGGEPFLEFELIKQIYEYAIKNWGNKKWIMFATTNGTLIHREIQKWLNERGRFICGLSLDGTKRMHDLNRSNSFNSIDLEFFKNKYPNQAVKMTISQETLGELSEGVIFIHEKGFQVNCNLAFGIDWSNENNRSILERELLRLIDFYLVNPKIKPCSMLDFPIEHLGVDKDRAKVRKWCGSGTDMKAYYCDGTSYPCQFFMPISAGETKARQSKNLFFEKDIPIYKIDDKCHNCVALEACPTCYGANFVSTGNIYKKDNNLCELTKIILKARSYFKALQWSNGLLKINSNREQALLRSIVKLQENL